MRTTILLGNFVNQEICSLKIEVYNECYTLSYEKSTHIFK